MKESNWKVTREAAFYLNVSERQLFRWRKEGLLVAGTHFMRKFPTENSSLLYDVELCRKAMQDAYRSNSNNVDKLGCFTEEDMRKMAIDGAICNHQINPTQKQKRQQWHQKMMYFYLRGNLPEEAINWLNPFD